MFLFKYLVFLLISLNNINSCNGFNLFLNRRVLLTSVLSAYSSPYLRNSLIKLDNDEEENTSLGRIDNNMYLTGGLTESTCLELSQVLIGYRNILGDKDFNYDKLNLYIQSPGGSLLPTLALIDEIKNFELPIETYIRGYAASAATLLSVVGKKRYMYNNSIMMIHGVKLSGTEMNTLLEVRDLNDNVNLFMDIIKNIYLENSNMTEEQLEKYFIRDKWMSSKEALNYGLIDEIIY
jgi:ATP-dependent Clp endopeptidase proteolytic subunit ClpP